MKKITHKLLWITLVCFITLSAADVANAQKKLIHYWNFNKLNTGLSAAVSPSAIPVVHADYSAIDTSKAVISYVPLTKVSSSYKTYLDAVAGDTVNARNGDPAGSALRVRNPSDSMELRFAMATKGYKNIVFKFALQRSGSGQIKELFDYSTDGGTNWSTKGLSIGFDSIASLATYLPIVVDISKDAAINDNDKFIFRIKFQGNTTQTNGNNRLDNVTLEGDATGTTPPASQKLIHYWHFNNFKGLSAAGSPSSIVPINANWSSLDSTKALISYVPSYKVSSNYKTYWDIYPVTAADSDKNNRMSAVDGNSLRVRNPSDSMQLLFDMPTLHYKNLTLTYMLEKSSLGSGQGKQVFDYSIDGGSSWKTSGLSIKSDSVTNVLFNKITLNVNADTMANNNPNFIFRILFKTQNSGTSGNNRFDNVTLEGDTDLSKTPNIFTGIEAPVAGSLNMSLYPNPVHNNLMIATGSEKEKTVFIYTLQGQEIYILNSRNTVISVDLNGLNNGIYLVKVLDNATGSTAWSKIVKN